MKEILRFPRFRGGNSGGGDGPGLGRDESEDDNDEQSPGDSHSGRQGIGKVRETNTST